MKSEKLFKTPLSPLQEKNSNLNRQECEMGKAVLDSCPRRIVFELTNRCNFNCIMCGRESSRFKGHDLPFSVIEACSPFLRFSEEVTLHGWGEGTLHPELPRILEYLNTFPLLRKYFVTNGSTLPKIQDLIFKHHVDLLAVSLDGATPEKNDSIRKGGNLDRELRSVKALMDEKRERGVNFPYVNFVFTAMMRNIFELPDMVALAHGAGVPELKVVFLTVFSESLQHESLVDKQPMIRDVFNEAKEAAVRLGINLKLPEIQGEGDCGMMPHKPCAFPWRDLYIGSDCFIRPCQSSSEKLMSFSDYPGVEKIWNAPPMQAFRKAVNNEQHMSDPCRRCYHSTCANWNLRSSFIQVGNTYAPAWDAKTAEAKSSKKCGAVAQGS